MSDQATPPSDRSRLSRFEQHGVNTTTQAKGQGGLPFTGFDLALLTAGGALLLTVGFGLRRVAKQKS